MDAASLTLFVLRVLPSVQHSTAPRDPTVDLWINCPCHRRNLLFYRDKKGRRVSCMGTNSFNSMLVRHVRRDNQKAQDAMIVPIRTFGGVYVRNCNVGHKSCNYSADTLPKSASASKPADVRQDVSVTTADN